MTGDAKEEEVTPWRRDEEGCPDATQSPLGRRQSDAPEDGKQSSVPCSRSGLGGRVSDLIQMLGEAAGVNEVRN